MKFATICSGIDAPTVAWKPMGWTQAFSSDIEPFPNAVRAHHDPDVPNYGDMTKFKEWPDHADIGLICAGTPCQAFSVAGLRKGLDDPRGNLTLTFLGILDRYRPEWVVWENVPGVLSIDGGRVFGAFLGGLGQLGYGFAYRILDAQYFGVAQRRRRVFVVGHLEDWRRAAAVLFERHSLQGHPAPSRKAGKVAPTIPARSLGGGGLGTDFDCDGGTICVATGQAGAEIGADMAPTLNCNHEAPILAHAFRGEGFDASKDGTGRGTPLAPWVAPTLDQRAGRSGETSFATSGGLVPVAQPYTLAIRGRGDTHHLEYRQDGTANALLTPNGGRGGIGVGAIATPVAFHPTQDPISSVDGSTHAIGCGSSGGQASIAVSFDLAQITSAANRTRVSPELPASTLNAAGQMHMATAMQVRRLTPRECERLQGFPDDYTAIPLRNANGKLNGKLAKDGPRYKALGNSMAVPVMAWIGRRIDAVRSLELEAAA